MLLDSQMLIVPRAWCICGWPQTKTCLGCMWPSGHNLNRIYSDNKAKWTCPVPSCTVLYCVASDEVSCSDLICLSGDFSHNQRSEPYCCGEREEKEEQSQGVFVSWSFLALFLALCCVWRTDHLHHQGWHPQSLSHTGGQHGGWQGRQTEPNGLMDNRRAFVYD